MFTLSESYASFNFQLPNFLRTLPFKCLHIRSDQSFLRFRGGRVVKIMSLNKRRAFSIEEKMKVINRIEKGETIKNLVSELGLSQSTISTIWKSRQKIQEKFEKDVTSKKKLRSSQHQDLEDALLEWFKVQRSRNIPLNGPILQEKANKLALLLGKENFECSMSWITRFRERNNIVFGRISGESSSVPTGVPENWLQNIWPTVRENYTDEDIYNADETGFFYRLTPDKTFRFKGETCHGGKHSKERVTVLIASNMTGSDKRKLLIIGKSKSPRCFKNVRNLPADYTNNKNAWMTSEIFTNWLRQWDKELERKKKKILLTVDNCPSHPAVMNLKNINLHFLPPNTTSVLQPMDQGIIQSLKVKFRKRLVLKMLDQSDNFKVSLLDAILMICDSWDEVTPKTIINCFNHGFRTDEAGNNQEDEPANFTQWAQKLDLNFDGDVQSYTEIDANIQTSEEPTEESIVASILNKSKEEEEDNDDTDGAEEDFKIPTMSQVYSALGVIRTYVALNDDVNKPENTAFLKELHSHVSKNLYLKKCKQTKITDFF